MRKRRRKRRRKRSRMRRRNCENGKFDIHEREKEKIGVKPARNRLKFGQKPA